MTAAFIRAVALLPLPVVLAGCLMAPLAIAPEGACAGQAGRDVAAAINAERVERSLEPLAFDRRLAAAAGGHSADMAAHGFVGHTGSDGSTLRERMAAAGYGAAAGGEVVAAGQATAKAALSSWMGSRRHREILLLPGLTRVGAACAASARGAVFWTAVVAADPQR